MDAELNPEFHFHLDEQIAENRATGVSRHEGPQPYLPLRAPAQYIEYVTRLAPVQGVG
jgi:hypothetical protein